MTRYELLLFLHILGAIVWFGGGVLLSVLAAQARKSGDPEAVLKLLQESDTVGNKVFFPASLVLLVAGILLVTLEDIGDWEDLWILTGIGGFVVSVFLGIFFYGPTGKKIGAAVEAGGPWDPAVMTLVDRYLLVARLDLLVLLVVVFAMTTKPGA